ncbi:archaeal flagellar protein FlaE [Halalkaliarchaeum desulfuricum]|uniref:Archaeal flagellar protein FlaE n=1 Tax=Halalkaliarchaeum desulfuricum TaxID=2055893 RepID=A0A343TNS6_9EURY|nr:FlaD/FlaE family flagellar protein [Halalkaliarchaeum desulfuricum]AUX10748.1 archaeal flagellar protein FlaE [Halalkaliarchaeum desulfuricum]
MGIETPVVPATTVAWLAATLGLVGVSILDRLLNNGGGDGDPLDGDFDDAGDEDDDPLDGDFDDAGDGDDDPLDGDFDDAGDDEEGTDTDELEKRLDELENEVATLSSTVTTVRSENAEISETVEDIEEDVQNLLDTHEMVAERTNPFVDGERYDGEGLGDEADATDTVTTETDMNDEDKSFSELKEEYDAGEADWADDARERDEVSVEPIPNEMEEKSDPTSETEPEPDPEQDPNSVSAGQGFDPETGRDPAAAGRRNRRQGEEGYEYVNTGGMANQEKPYLTSLPGDYVGDLVVMEWLEFLVSNADVTDAVRAVNYYERVKWITPEVAEDLREFLSGFGRVDLNLVDQPGTDVLTREHHTQSLRYIMQLNGATAHSVLLDRWDEFGSGAAFGGPATGSESSASGGARSGNGSGQSEPHAGSRGDEN